MHVNITQPSDFTFRSHRIIAGVPLLPDNLMRDHRKIAFYDVTEIRAVPRRDGAVGRRGRRALRDADVGRPRRPRSRAGGARGARRRAAPAQAESRSPTDRSRCRFAKRSRATPARSAAAIGRRRSAGAASELGRALQVHNEPGFGRKQATVARAMLYTLAPRGSVLIVPDGLWLESSWAGMLAGAALRGCRVYVVGPALANAPSAGLPADVADVGRHAPSPAGATGIQQEIQHAGGELRIGLYTASDGRERHRAAGKSDQRRSRSVSVASRSRSVRRVACTAVFDSAPAVLQRAGYKPFVLGRDEAPRLPQLHRKTQFFADSAALARLDAVAPNGVRSSSRPSSLAPSRRGAGRKTGLYDDTVTHRRGRRRREAARGVQRQPSARRQRAHDVLPDRRDAERGPSRQLLDGEAVFVFSGMSAAVGLVDLYSLHGAEYLDRDGGGARSS